MKLKPALAALLTIMFISSCVSVGASKNNCSWIKPIFIEDKDKLTSATARTILLHNETWDKLCN